MSLPTHAARRNAPDPGDLKDLADRLLDRVDAVVLDKGETTRLVFSAMLAGGHMLLEDIPGVGKTTLAVTLGRLFDLRCTRVQFTPDTMPSDLVGFSVWRQDSSSFEYQPGAALCNVLVADEINRTSPKTQSALLEVMEERSVTVDGVTRRVPEPFFVLATQNPLGSVGTQPLPPSQLDRFMACASMGYPSFEAELEMARTCASGRRTDAVAPMAQAADLVAMQREAAATYAGDAVLDYAVRLVSATRADARLALGASPRATTALVRLAKASAWLRGSDYVAPADVEPLFLPVARHRVQLDASAAARGLSVDDVLADIAGGVQRPRLALGGRRGLRDA